MTRKRTNSKPKLAKGKGKRNLDPMSAYYGLSAASMAPSVIKQLSALGESRKKRKHRNPPNDVELFDTTSPTSPSRSLGHICFEEQGSIERFVRNGYVYRAFSSTPVWEDGYRIGAPIGPVSDQEMRYVSNPAKFDRCVRDVKASGKDVNAYAVCTAAGTLRNPSVEKLYAVLENKAGQWVNQFSGLTFDAATRIKNAILGNGGEARVVRSNPQSTSDQVYEEFHGTPPAETLEYRERLHVHGHLAGLGDLVHIVVKLTGGTKAGKEKQLNAPDPNSAKQEDIVRLACNEAKNQLYFVGGDQSIDLTTLGFRDSFTISHDGESFDATDIRDHMVIGKICRIMYRTEKEFDKFETIDYHHLTGEDTRKYPLLTYDTMNQKMGVVGGEYSVHADGIVN